MLLGCANPAQESGAGAVVLWPDVKTGDCWTYRRVNYLTDAIRDTYELCTTFADAKAIHSIARFEGLTEPTDLTWTADWNPVTFSNAVQRTEAGLLQFPLKLGHEYHAIWEEEVFSMGLRTRHERIVKLERWEEVVVPAGTFKALRIEARGTYERTWGGISIRNSGPARSTIWYAPAIKRWVKRVDEVGLNFRGDYQMGSEMTRTGEELTGFRFR
jgi:hypothetical protein